MFEKIKPISCKQCEHLPDYRTWATGQVRDENENRAGPGRRGKASAPCVGGRLYIKVCVLTYAFVQVIKPVLK